MKLICLREKIKHALSITERIIGRNLTLPILNNILLSTEKNKIKVSSTNLEIGINCWINAKIIQEGSITIPAKIISDFINNLNDKKIEINAKDNYLNIKCDKFKSKIKSLNADDFPIIPQIKEKPLLKIKGNILKDGFSQIVEMASYSESRPEISGICMNFTNDSLKLVATDSFRLAEKSINLDTDKLENQFIIIPQRTIQELIRILGEKSLSPEEDSNNEVEIILANNQILFNLGYIQIISRLIEGQYPNYQQLIPNEVDTQVVLDRQEFINNIKIASLFSGKINDVKILINPTKSLIEISSKDIDIGENKSSLNAEIKGNQMELDFNYRHLLDGLNNIFSDKVVLLLNNNNSPVVLKPFSDDSYTYIIMPIRINNN